MSEFLLHGDVTVEDYEIFIQCKILMHGEQIKICATELDAVFFTLMIPHFIHDQDHEGSTFKVSYG